MDLLVRAVAIVTKACILLMDPTATTAPPELTALLSVINIARIVDMVLTVVLRQELVPLHLQVWFTLRDIHVFKFHFVC